MENKDLSNELNSRNQLPNPEYNSLDMPETPPNKITDSNILEKPQTTSDMKAQSANISNKPAKPPKLEDKPFEEFISNHLIPGLKTSIEAKGTLVSDIKLIEGKRPVVGDNCWMVFCEMSEERKFWLCFNKDILTSDKTILLAESNSDPSIVESFLIDEKKTTLPLLISRVLQRLNGQKWIGMN